MTKTSQCMRCGEAGTVDLTFCDNCAPPMLALLKKVEFHCTRCSHKWKPTVANPQRCPKCKSPRWNTPRRNNHFKCKQCGYEWNAMKKEGPAKCPNHKCESRHWNTIIQKYQFTCQLCNYKWTSRIKEGPKQCPGVRCSSKYWNALKYKVTL